MTMTMMMMIVATMTMKTMIVATMTMKTMIAATMTKTMIAATIGSGPDHRPRALHGSPTISLPSFFSRRNAQPQPQQLMHHQPNCRLGAVLAAAVPGAAVLLLLHH
jgi:hypothetical protein